MLYNTTKKILIFTFILSCSTLVVSFVNNKNCYQLFTKNSKKADFENMMEVISKADIVLFGELHNNPIAHWLELQVAKGMYTNDANMSIAMEMFEADDQLALNEYLSGSFDDKQFMKEVKLWENYKTDYKPLVDFAKKNKVPVIASNIPRRYANMVYKKGIASLDSITNEAKLYIAPLPITIDLNLKGYKEMMADMGTHGIAATTENMAKSQAVKDATMAYFTLKYKKGKVLHVNGSYHSNNYEGIVWYLKQANPNLKIVTINAVEQEDISKLDSAFVNTADYIISIPEDMTKSY